jgi:hypothetical protein
MEMTARERKVKKTIEYLSDKNNLRSFVLELQEYIGRHIDNGCSYREDTNDPYINTRYFIRFCNIKKFDWDTVNEYFQDEDNYWCRCDCDYYHKIAINAKGDIAYVQDRIN